MGILAGTRSRRGNDASGRWVMIPKDVTAPPRRRARVIERRRRAFTRLLAVVSLTFVAGFVPALRWVWFAHVAADAAMALYVWRLLQIKRSEDVPAFEPQPTIVLDDADAPSIQTYRLDPEPAIAPVAGEDRPATPGWMTRTG